MAAFKTDPLIAGLVMGWARRQAPGSSCRCPARDRSPRGRLVRPELSRLGISGLLPSCLGLSLHVLAGAGLKDTQAARREVSDPLYVTVMPAL
jgi:hypothetical protein